MLPGSYRNPLYDRGRVYWYAWRGGPLIWSGKLEQEADAAVEIARGYYEARDARPAAPTFEAVVDAFEQSRAFAALKPVTQKLYATWIKRIRAEFGGLAHVEVTPRRVYQWRERCAAAHGVRAADTGVGVLSRLCAWAREPGRALLAATIRPTDDLPGLYRAPTRMAPPVEDVLATIAALRRVGDDPVADAIALALNTGLRRTDLCAIHGGAVDMPRHRILWAPSKGARKRRRVVIHIGPALGDLLERLEWRPGDPLLTTSRGTAWTPDGLSASVEAALKRQSVTWRLHDVRAAAATHLATQGWSSRAIALVLGWSEREAETMAATYVNQEAVLTRQGAR